MLSFTDGRPVAIIKGGKNHNKIIYVCEDDKNEVIYNNPLDILEDVFDENNRKKMSRLEISAIKYALISKDKSTDLLKDIYNRSENKSKKEFKIYDDGIVQPLPRFNKTERCYIAGQTECGKS